MLASVEVGRVARRLGASAPQLAANLLSRLNLLAIEPIIADAALIGGPLLRSLDAIHLATAASIAGELGALITYDRRMIHEATAIGLNVISPA